jgi:mono/diheme cytochrome c family protein
MNQKKYIMSAVLVLVVGFIIYIGFKKIPPGKDVVNPENIIDNNKTIDTLTQSQQNGKMLFMGKCATCHAIFKNDGDISRLLGFTEREPWNTR